MTFSKLTLSAAALACAVAVSSCQREYSPAKGEDGSYEGLFTASLDCGTKTILDSVTVKWQPDDSISINGVIYEVYSIDPASDSTEAKFIKRHSYENYPCSPFQACFPSDIYDKANGGYSIPGTIVADPRTGAFNMPMYASSKSNIFAFKNICGVLGVKVNNEDAASVSSLSVYEHTGKALRTLICKESVNTTEDSLFYIPVLPGVYDSLQVDVFDSTGTFVGTMVSRSKKVEVTANTVYYFNYQTSVKGISLSSDSLNLYVGLDSTLTAVIDPENAKNKTVIWSSENEAVATVSDGCIHPVGGGTTLINAITQEGGYKASCFIKVVVPAKSINLANNTFLQSGASGKLTTTCLPAGCEQTLTWSLVSGDAATIDKDGNIQALKEGTAVIKPRPHGE